MAKDRSDQRKYTRLPGRGSLARQLAGEKPAGLPIQAVVSDISEGGVGLKFSWPVGQPPPAESGDGLGFRLKVQGTDRAFEVMSTVRHVVRDGGDLRLGVEFWGLAHEIREELKTALLNLAVTALRTWRISAPVQPEAGAEAAPEAAVGAESAGNGAADPVAAMPEKRRKLYLGEILVKRGVLDSQRLERFLSMEFTGRKRLGKALTERGLIDEEALARALAEQGRLPYIDLGTEQPDLKLAARLPRQVFTKHWCLPIREEDGALLVAMSAPPDLKAFEEIREAAKCRVRMAVAAEDKLAEWLKRVYNMEGAPRPMQMRFPVQLHVEYRFLTTDWKKPVDERPTVGLTREASRNRMVIAGPLPAGVTPERISAEGLRLAVKADCAEVSGPLAVGCVPEKVTRSDYRDEYYIECRIEKFPKDGEMAWTRLCLLRGTVRFHPEARGG